MFDRLTQDNLVWFPSLGLGYYSVPPSDIYNEDYFAKYKGYADTEMGRKISQFRVDWVNTYAPGLKVLDVGIGSGQFLETLGFQRGSGYDINPAGVQWLEERRLLRDLGSEQEDCLTFWDSLEHIKDPEVVLRAARRFVFISIPIFRDAEHVLQSKHFRKDEHYWYFTNWGLINWMKTQGFVHCATSQKEEYFGREDVLIYAFDRVQPCQF